MRDASEKETARSEDRAAIKSRCSCSSATAKASGGRHVGVLAGSSDLAICASGAASGTGRHHELGVEIALLHEGQRVEGERPRAADEPGQLAAVVIEEGVGDAEHSRIIGVYSNPHHPHRMNGLLSIALLVAATTLRGATFVVGSDADLVLRSDVIAYVRPLGHSTHPTRDAAETTYRFAVLATLRGEPSDIVDVTEWGGERDGLVFVNSAACHYEEGVEYLLFLQHHGAAYRTVGMQLGCFEIGAASNGEQRATRHLDSVLQRGGSVKRADDARELGPFIEALRAPSASTHIAPPRATTTPSTQTSTIRSGDQYCGLVSSSTGGDRPLARPDNRISWRLT